MAEAVHFPGCNRMLGAPEGSENIFDLYTFNNGCCSVSCWQLSEDELAEVTRTGRVFLSILSGPTQHPCFVGSEETVRSVVVDFGGVWRAAR